MNGYNLSVSQLTGTGIVTNNSAASSTSLTIAATGAPTFSGTIENGNTGRTVGLIMDGNATQTLSGTNYSYTGNTSVEYGQLARGRRLRSGNTAITVASGAWFAPNPCGGTVIAGSTGTGTAGATLNLPNGSILNMGSIGTFDLRQQSGFGGRRMTINTAKFDFGLSAAGSAVWP